MVRRSVSLLSLILLSPFAAAQGGDGLAKLQFFSGSPTLDNATASLAPPPAAVPTEPSADKLAAIRARVDRVSELEAREGARSTALGEELVALSALYRDVGDHALAIASLERALGVLRMNQGLHSLDQVPLLEGIIDSRIALGAFEQAAAIDRAVLELVARNPDDPRVPDVLVGVADREMETVQRFIEFGSGPQFNVGVSPMVMPQFIMDRQQLVPGSREYVPVGPVVGGVSVVSGRRAALLALRRARAHYGAAIAATKIANGNDVAELFAIEEKIIDTFYTEVVNPELWPSGRGASYRDMPIYRPGERALRTHVINSMNHRRTAVAVAEALLRLGDWQLLFSRNATALETYESVYDLLVRENVSSDIIKGLLTPDVPAILLPSSLEEATSYRGFVDVSLVVGRYGRVKNVKIVGTSEDTSDEIVKRAKRFLANTRLRPRFIGGELARNDRVMTRYYYDY